jgi:nucleotide-binding universal stress UspA family protein
MNPTHSPFRIQKILFPTDFSKSSEAAASHVTGLAHVTNAKVYLLNVVPWLSGWHGASEPEFAVSDDVLRKLTINQKAIEASCLKMLETLRLRHFQDTESDLLIRTGSVAESIVDYAQEIRADLIMMPTRGLGPPRPFLIGPVTAKVLHDSRCAVWTSPHPRELDMFHRYRQIVCAMDYRFLSRDLLARAAEVTKFWGARLSLVSAIPCPVSGPIPCVTHESVRLLKNETVSGLHHLLNELRVEASLCVIEGPVGEVIRGAATMEDADLVVIGRGHLDDQMGHLRTHAYEIIWNSPCPVLSLASESAGSLPA